MRIGARLGFGALSIAAAVLALQLAADSTRSHRRPIHAPLAPAVMPPAVAIAPAPPAPRPLVAPSTHGPCTPLDFDGDGVTDRYEPVPDSCGTGGCTYDLYLVRATGDRHVGQIDGRCTFELAPRAHGLADVLARWRLGATDTVVTRYRFDGRRYRAIR